MLKYIKCLAILLFFAHYANAQLGKSPYTINGIGDIQGMSLIHNDVMGGVGISNARPWNLSNINPALLPMNGELTNFEVGLVAERRIVTQDSLNQENGGVNLNYLAFGFPIKPGRLTVSVGFMPYSSVDYSVETTSNVIGGQDQVGVSFNGSGGVNQAYIAAGARFFKHLYIGARAGYLFGAINNDIIIDRFAYDLNDSLFATNFKSSYFQRTSYSDFYFGAGVAYEFRLSERTYLNVGGIYDFQADVSASRFERLERKDTRTEQTISSLVLSEDEKGQILLPSKYGFGLSLQRGTRWNIASDIIFQDWSQFEDFNNGANSLEKSMRMNVGLEFIPDFFSVRNYFDRVSYMAGFNYENTPYVKNDEQINEFGINFGVSFPVSAVSRFTLGFKYGQRGRNGDEIIKEDFYRVSLGVTFNDRWFIRRKYD